MLLALGHNPKPQRVDVALLAPGTKFSSESRAIASFSSLTDRMLVAILHNLGYMQESVALLFIDHAHCYGGA